ncbi:MAG: hypothetical protein ACRYG7_21175 [Janthinobacterium lividum]
MPVPRRQSIAQASAGLAGTLLAGLVGCGPARQATACECALRQPGPRPH